MSGEPERIVAGRPRGRVSVWPFLALIVLYRWTLSPLIGGQCRFEPTCSRYAEDAYRRHGAVRGSLLTLRRLMRCHPLCRGGYDPVPLEDGCGAGDAGSGDATGG